jgi:predicted TIM-barrel fold metal-dependent hydrolase
LPRQLPAPTLAGATLGMATLLWPRPVKSILWNTVASEQAREVCGMSRIIDVWMQHPTERHSADEMFASLCRWTAKTPRPAVITPQTTIAAMDHGGVSVGLAAAWCAPHGWMISHEEVASVAKAYPGRILGVASANLYKPMEAVRELRRAVKELGFRALRVVPWLWSLPPNDVPKFWAGRALLV